MIVAELCELLRELTEKENLGLTLLDVWVEEGGTKISFAWRNRLGYLRIDEPDFVTQILNVVGEQEKDVLLSEIIPSERRNRLKRDSVIRIGRVCSFDIVVRDVEFPAWLSHKDREHLLRVKSDFLEKQVKSIKEELSIYIKYSDYPHKAFEFFGVTQEELICLLNPVTGEVELPKEDMQREEEDIKRYTVSIKDNRHQTWV